MITTFKKYFNKNYKYTMAIVLVLLLSITNSRLYAQVTKQWVATYNGNGDYNDRYTCTTTDATGNIYIAGSTTNEGLDRDILVVKLSSTGSVLWSKQYSGTGSGADEATAITTDASNNVYVTGFAKGLNTSEDYATLKLNSAGTLLWMSTYDYVTEFDQANSITVDASGNVYVTGLSDQDPTFNTNDDYATIKYNSSGVQQWVVRYDNSNGNATDQAQKIVSDASGNVYVTGRSNNGSDDDFVTIKYNSAGTQQWIKTNDRGSRDRAVDMTIDASSNIYITGSSDNGNDQDYWTIKYNSAGTLQWQKVYNFLENDYPASIAVDATGNVYVTGESDGDASTLTDYDYQTVAYSSTGTQLWQKRYAGTVGRDMATVVKVSGGFVYVTGQSNAGTATVIKDDAVTIKYASATGVASWTSTFSGSPNNDDNANDLVVTSTGAFIVGHSEDANFNRNAIAVQYNSSGAQSWTENFDGHGDNNDNIRAIAIDANNNVLAAGYTVERGTNRNVALVKFSSTGSVVCNNNIDGTSTGSADDGQAIVLDNAGNPIVAGFIKNKGTTNDMIIAKYGSNCDTAFTKVIDGAGHGSDKIYDMVKDATGNLYITGRTDMDAQATINDDCYTAKLDANGTIVWSGTYNNSATNEDRGISIKVSSAGNVYVTGRTWNGTNYDIFIIKYNSSGTQQWVQVYSGGNGNDEPQRLVLDASENVYVCGNTEETTAGIFDFVTMKYNSSGAQQWVKKYNGTGSGNDLATALALDAANNVIVLGTSDVMATADSNYDIVAVKYNNAGVQQWTKNYNGTASLDDVGDDIAVGSSDNIYITGHTNKGSILAPNYDVITYVLDPSGSKLWSDIHNSSSDSSDIPNLILLNGNDFYVAGSTVAPGQMRNMMVIKYTGKPTATNDIEQQNSISIYPNPFQNSINIENIVTPASFVLFDAIGQQVFETTLNKGSNLISIPELKNGFYSYFIKLSNHSIISGKLNKLSN